MRTWRLGTVFAVVVFGLSASAAAVPVPLQSTLFLRAAASADSDTLVVTDEQTFTQSGTLDPLTGSVAAHHAIGDSSVTTTLSGIATWSGAAEGSVAFNDVGWVTENVPSAGQAITFDSFWSYQFTSDVNGEFELDFLVTGAGTVSDGSDPLFGLGGFFFNWNGNPTLMATNSSGVLTRSVTAGLTYTAEIQSAANIFGVLNTRTQHQDGTFAWCVGAECEPPALTSTVPEPGTLLLLGPGLAALAARRRRARGGNRVV